MHRRGAPAANESRIREGDFEEHEVTYEHEDGEARHAITSPPQSSAVKQQSRLHRQRQGGLPRVSRASKENIHSSSKKDRASAKKPDRALAAFGPGLLSSRASAELGSPIPRSGLAPERGREEQA